MDTVQQAAEVLSDHQLSLENDGRVVCDGLAMCDWRGEYNRGGFFQHAAQELAKARLLADTVPRERYVALDQLAPGDRIWLDGAWREVVATADIDGEIQVFAGAGDRFAIFTAPAALLVRRAEA